ncbi:hypothetical protein C8A01DRAFT_19032 [Parachaetomium inaequale]|uniref:Uncharacterized protein n=1 Tax=Parachaetomium inaequale TaxID=2588326 RepID=A0AAN6SNH0_9PEZI|nr:hypothetical protein C8A01DRAFT_19032 [Parachaetomium inaequale]
MSETVSETVATITPSTTAVLQALTTPFVPPPDCADRYITTSFAFYTSSLLTVFASNLARDGLHPTCQPSGWNAGVGFEFSPAVCPNGWTAHRLGATTVAAIEDATTTHTKNITTAYCCASGFTPTALWFHLEGLSSSACFQTVWPTGTTTTTTSRHDSIHLHNAWHISWASSDIPSLSPAPPQLGCTTGVAIFSWVPGAKVDSMADMCSRGEEHPNFDGLPFLMIGLPIIVIVIAASCFGMCCYYSHRPPRRDERGRAAGSGGRPDDIVLEVAREERKAAENP